MEQQNVDQISGLLDAASDEYDTIVWRIAGLVGQMQAAMQALAMCQQGQAGEPTMEKAAPSFDDFQKVINEMNAAIGKLREQKAAMIQSVS